MKPAISNKNMPCPFPAGQKAGGNGEKNLKKMIWHPQIFRPSSSQEKKSE